MWTENEINIINEHNMVKNLNWQKADQVAIYKYSQGIELRRIENNTASG